MMDVLAPKSYSLIDFSKGASTTLRDEKNPFYGLERLLADFLVLVKSCSIGCFLIYGKLIYSLRGKNPKVGVYLNLSSECSGLKFGLLNLWYIFQSIYYYRKITSGIISE